MQNVDFSCRHELFVNEVSQVNTVLILSPAFVGMDSVLGLFVLVSNIKSIACHLKFSYLKNGGNSNSIRPSPRPRLGPRFDVLLSASPLSIINSLVGH